MNTPFPRLNTRPQLLAAFVIYCLLPLVAYAQGQPARRQQSPAPSRSPLEAKADAIVERTMRDKCIPGLVLAVVKDGQVVVKKGYGFKSLEAQPAAPPDENTLFYIASLSKAITAVGLLRLVDLGQLTLTDKVSQYVADVPAEWRDIQLRYLLAHQSGIPELAQKLPTFAAMLRGATHKALAFAPPGSCQEYNNFNFAVAGKVIEAASKQRYLDFMQAEVFQPLGMTRTGYQQKDANSATGYVRTSDTGCYYKAIENSEPRGGPYAIPSGFLQTTLADLLKLYRAIEGRRLLSPASYEAMLNRVTPQFNGTPGWFAREVGGVKIVAKSGSGAEQGFASQFQFAPERRAAVIFIQNLPATQTGEMANELLREVCGLPIPIKAAPASAPDKLEAVAKPAPRRCVK